MKKLSMLFVAALFAVMTVVPAFAADNLELSGSFRVRGWDIDSAGFTDNNDSSWFDQRMRVNAKIKANDSAYVVIRADLGDAVWGQDFTDLAGGAARPRGNGDASKSLDFDRLYGVLDRDMFTLTVGQQFYGLGILEVMDAQITGAKLALKFDGFSPSFTYGKVDENNSLNDDNANDDTNLYGLNISFKLGAFDSNLFYTTIDNKATDDQPWAVGFHVAGALGPVNLAGEVATFGGDNGANVDYVGTQFYLKADSNVTDMINVGGELFYALGTDDNAETQITNLVDWWTFTPMSNNTPGDADFSALASDPFDLATVAGGDGAGTVGATLFIEVKPMDALSLGAKVGYWVPEEDNATTLDSLTAFNAWIAYKLGANTTASLTYLIASPDFDVATTNDEDTGTLYAKYQINF